MACLEIVYENESAISYGCGSIGKKDVLGRGESTEMDPLFTILPPLGDCDFIRMKACFVHWAHQLVSSF